MVELFSLSKTWRSPFLCTGLGTAGWAPGPAFARTGKATVLSTAGHTNMKIKPEPSLRLLKATKLKVVLVCLFLFESK